MRIKLIENDKIDWDKKVKYNQRDVFTEKSLNKKKSYKMGYTSENKRIKKYGFNVIADYDWAA